MDDLGVPPILGNIHIWFSIISPFQPVLNMLDLFFGGGCGLKPATSDQYISQPLQKPKTSALPHVAH